MSMRKLRLKLILTYSYDMIVARLVRDRNIATDAYICRHPAYQNDLDTKTVTVNVEA